ncbi:alpha/beta fold hydrolase [Roseibium sp.]|uniref:alpha/beta fold hydrolase n=1 Tax=Roseibium sp. TaxID=1936156 RepID=UPI0039EEBC7D
MKLVLLPGLDGTGKLFAPILPLLDDHDVVVMPLPQTGTQTYVELSQQVRSRLPREDFVLVAESFSGPIAAMIAKEGNSHLKGIVFVASFLSPPAPLLSRLACLLPLTAMINFPGSSLAIRFLCLGMDATDQMVVLFKNVAGLVPSRALKSRLRELGKFRLDFAQIATPAGQLVAKHDLLVGQRATESIVSVFPAIENHVLEGPHFLMQAKPERVADHIRRFVASVVSSDPFQSNAKDF